MQALIDSRLKGLVLIGGPTASGKTDFAVEIARHYQTVILSADSRQLYREMNIGTAKPDEETLRKVKHYFISSLSVTQEYSVADYLNDAGKLIAELSAKHEVIVVCGGTGLYLSALKNGIHQLPGNHPILREELEKLQKEHGVSALKQRLLDKDPDAGKRVDLNNPRRLIRAIELVEETGLPLAKIFEQKPPTLPYKIISICLDVNREILYQRINQRVDLMVNAGLENEVRNLMEFKNNQALQTVGYREWWDYFNGKQDRNQTIEAIKQNTRNYAKRQVTWFKKDKENHWLSPDSTDAAIRLINRELLIGE